MKQGVHLDDLVAAVGYEGEWADEAEADFLEEDVDFIEEGFVLVDFFENGFEQDVFRLREGVVRRSLEGFQFKAL